MATMLSVLAILGEQVIGAFGITSYISRVGADPGCLQWAGILSLISSRSLPSMIPSQDWEHQSHTDDVYRKQGSLKGK